jgi:hypothetical protein
MKHLILLKTANNIITKLNLFFIKKMSEIFLENHLEKLLKLYPNEDWDYEWLSQNPNITW